jgi:NAD(P)-dependent dehydrogenase (short-subunit alcohol dehydrogenase family)
MTHPARFATPYTSRTTADEVIQGVDLSGKRAIVTGGASGVGAETVRALAGAGADVTLAVRDVEAGRRVADRITGTTGNPQVNVTQLEPTDRASVARLVEGWEGPLHILVNNAGIMALPDLHRTDEGWELQFATNHLGHFQLALGLHSTLAAGAGARIVSVSSNAHQTSPIVFDDIHFWHRPYEAWSAYGQSKTANVLFAVEAGRRWADDNEAELTTDPESEHGVRPHALDEHDAARLWDVSSEMLGS